MLRHPHPLITIGAESDQLAMQEAVRLDSTFAP
jgi:hypothetical protein